MFADDTDRLEFKGISETPQPQSLETPDEGHQVAARGTEFPGSRRLLLQQDRPYRYELLVTREALVIPDNERRNQASTKDYGTMDGAESLREFPG